MSDAPELCFFLRLFWLQKLLKLIKRASVGHELMCRLRFVPAGLQNRGVEQAPTGTQADYLMAYCSLLMHFCRFYRSTSSRLCAFERIADLLSAPTQSVS